MEQDLSSYKLTYRNIVETALVALSSDPAIREWCVAEYGFPPMVANDADPMDPPQERDCPYISVTPLGGENGQDDDRENDRDDDCFGGRALHGR